MRTHTVAFALACACVLVGCHASFRGGQIQSLRSEDNSLGRAEAHPCPQPDIARRSEVRRQGCKERCSLIYGELSGACSFIRPSEEREGVTTLDMSGLQGVSLRVQVCNPTGINLHMADSPTAVLQGGDAGSSDNDAQVILDGTRLILRPAEATRVPASIVEDYVGAEGCHWRVLEFADSAVYIADLDQGLCGSGMLRIDPPHDPAGRPDALWYLALGHSIDGRGTAGQGLEAAELCSW